MYYDVLLESYIPVAFALIGGVLFFILLYRHDKHSAPRLPKKYLNIGRREKLGSKILENKELILETILDNTLCGIITIDEKGIIQSFNKCAETIFHYSAQEVLGKNISILMPESDAEMHDAYISQYLDDGKQKIIGIERKIIGKRQNGELFPIEIAVSQINMNNNKMFIGMIQDISEKETARLELIKHRNNLQHLVDEQTIDLKNAKELAEIACQDAVHANQLKTEFLANMTHELRTPMHAIMGFAELGKININTLDKNKYLKYLSEIYDNGERLLSLLNDLLDLSKLESHVIEYDMHNEDIVEIIDEAIGSLRSLIDKKQIQIHVNDFDDAANYIDLDKKKIVQVLWNVLSNAIKFSSAESYITIRLEQAVLTAPIDYDNPTIPAISIMIIDQGIGIPNDELLTIFDKFIQSRKTKTNAGGTGLGLAICKEIIEGHHGTIWAENNSDGIGARIIFTLPISQIAYDVEKKYAA